MKKVYLVGFLYDDFAEGGFEIVFATLNEEKAIEVLEEKRKDAPSNSPYYGYVNGYGLRVLRLNEKDEEKVIERLDI
jgi:hypothetical protein